MAYLGIVVLTTIVLYYLYYVEGAVTPLMLPYYHMSFLYFLYLLGRVECHRRIHRHSSGDSPTRSAGRT